MRTLKIFQFIVLILFFTSSCQDVLDKKPIDIISDDVVWNDPGLIDGYLAGLYDQTSVFINESLSNYRYAWSNLQNNSITLYGPFLINEMSDESKRGWLYLDGDNVKYNGITSLGGKQEWYETAYQIIRSANYFIQNIQGSPIDAKLKAQKIAEARFIRAFNFFAMVKRYGGVPILTEPGDINNPIYPKRDTEQAVYDFIIKEVDQFANDLEANNSDNADYGRATKYAAYALQCRAALYAGSIAKYGKVDIGGIVGIPSNLANNYFQKSYDAAALIIGTNHSNANYQLYNAESDKATNFRNIFMVKDNSEVIFAKKFDGVGTNGWCYDFLQCPQPQAWNVGNENAVYLDFVTDFEKSNGTKYDITPYLTGTHSITEIWGNMDTRFYATIYTMNTPWQGTLVDYHNGIVTKPGGIVVNTGNYKGLPAQGNMNGAASFGTGFGVMKYLDESHNNMQSAPDSKTDYIIFRYAEILLNYAEAANELGKNADALWAVNEVRNRAGVAALATVTRDQIRHERKIELAFEGHRYWDLRRWRIAVDNIQKYHQGLRYILDYSSIAADTNNPKFQLEILDKIDSKDYPPPFTEANYYLPITQDRIAKSNGNLVENPGY